MQTPRTLLAAFFAVSALTVTAFSADPSGNWKWTSVKTAGGPSEVTAALVLKGDAITGTVTTRQGPADISDGTFKDGVVAFSVTRNVGNDQTVTFKYSGTVTDDTITGTIERPAPADAPPNIVEWKATRVK